MSRMQRVWTEARQRGEQRRRRMTRRLPRWRTRPRRRALVALWLPIPLTLSVLSLALDWDKPAHSLIYVAVLAFWYPLWLILRVLTTASAEAVAALLDEREVALRNRLGYVALNVLVITNVLVFCYATTHERDPLVAARTAYLLMSCTILAVSAPTALLAWRMPDDDPEDLEDPDRSPARAGNDEGGISA